MRSYFLGSGVVLVMLYVIAAAFIVKLLGVELSQYWWTLMLGAGVMLAGTYAIIMLVWVATNIGRRFINRQPLWDRED